MKHIHKEQIKAVFFDIDGTYYDQITHTIPHSNIQAVHKLQQAGYKVALASARPFSTAKNLPILESVSWDGIVSAGGQEVYDERYQLLHRNSFSKAELKEIFSISDKNSFPIYTVGETDFFTMDAPILDTFRSKFHLICDTIHPYIDEDVLLITLLMGKDFRYEPYFDHMPNVRIQYTGGDNTDLFPKHVTKPSGIHQLMEHWGFPVQDYMAFGDSGSDMEMMQDAGISVAMGNGSEECRNAADFICGNSNEDGIFEFLTTHQFFQK